MQSTFYGLPSLAANLRADAKIAPGDLIADYTASARMLAW